MAEELDFVLALFRGMEGDSRKFGSDMSAHMPTLYLLARMFAPIGKVVELGSGFSSVGLLAGVVSVGGRLHSYDISNQSLERAFGHFGVFKDDPRMTAWSRTAMDSIRAANDFENGSVSMMFLDTVHSLDVTREELRIWLPKIHPKGIICGHDYYLAGAGVDVAVKEFLVEHASRFRLQVQPHDQGLFILWPIAR